jgi:hypothetical protein
MPKKKPELIKVPDQKEFAIRMADAFLQDGGMAVQVQEDETSLDVILSIPEIHLEFTAYICNVLREKTYGATKAPDGLLN